MAEKIGTIEFQEDFKSITTTATSTSAPTSELSFQTRSRQTWRDTAPEYSVFRDPRSWWKQNLESWQFYCTLYSGGCLLITLILVLGLSVAAAIHGVDEYGRTTLPEGSCGKARVNFFFGRYFISGLGALMLAASIFVMVRYLAVASAQCAHMYADNRM